MSLSDYLVAEIRVVAERPTLTKLRRRLSSRSRVRVSRPGRKLECSSRLVSEISNSRAEDVLDDLADLPLNRYPHDVLLSRIWELRNSATAYDAAYLALAEALDAPLVTRDRRLAASQGHRAKIEVI